MVVVVVVVFLRRYATKIMELIVKMLSMEPTQYKQLVKKIQTVLYILLLFLLGLLIIFHQEPILIRILVML